MLPVTKMTLGRKLWLGIYVFKKQIQLQTKIVQYFLKAF